MRIKDRKLLVFTIMSIVTKEMLIELNNKHCPDKKSKPLFEWDINCGLCGDWADKVSLLLDKVGIDNTVYQSVDIEKYEDLPIHVFMKIGNLYYDCECLTGAKKVTELPIYERNINLDREKTRKYSLFSIKRK